MRRPQTKTPYAYFRTAQRNRGRPVHRIYAETPRPPMTGTWGYYALFHFLADLLCYSKDGNFWYVGHFDQATTLGLFSSPTPGDYWNENFWTINYAPVASWSLVDTLTVPCKGTLGPIIQPFDLVLVK